MFTRKFAAAALLVGLTAAPAFADNVDSYGRATARFDAASAGESQINLGQPVPHAGMLNPAAPMPRAGAPGAASAGMDHAGLPGGHMAGRPYAGQGPNYSFAYDR